MAKATREAYGSALAELVKERKDIIVLDADLSKSTKTADAKKANPACHYNLGIAEGNMMGVAAGLAASNKVVFASSFAMFAAGRAFEQIRNSICYPKLNVKVCATHAGITVGEDGASHQSVEDIALMRSIPNMKVYQPCDYHETKALIKAIAAEKGPCYVRLGRLGVEDVFDENYTIELGKGVVLKKGSKIAIVASGMMVQEVLKANELLSDLDPTIVNIHTIKPLDKELIIDLAKHHDYIFTVEEHNIIGGLGSAISEVLATLGLPCKQIMIGINDTFGRSGKPIDLLDHYELNAAHIARKIKNSLK